MMKSGKMKPHSSKASIKDSNTEECFSGFDVDDNLLATIETKKNDIINIVTSETGEPMEVSTPTNNSPSIVNNNHVNKKSQSKSRVSSPPESNSKHNKRLKKDSVPSETIESADVVNIQPSLELSTPTFNLTSSTPRNRSSSSRKPTVDITDPIFKLPFEHGWKRELVYRTTGEATTIHRGNRNGDVYYYSPNNRKLRSLREIQEQLNLSLNEENPLTIESFTFLKQPIGMDDKSKELIREANSKVPKEDSFLGSIRPKKVKTPARPSFDHELSDNENNKSPNKMKIVFKNVKKSRSKAKKDNKNNLDAINLSPSTPEYIAEDWQAMQSSAAGPKVIPLKNDDTDLITTNKKRRNSEMNGSLRELPASNASRQSMQSITHMIFALRHVFKFLKTHELLVASRVCVGWNIIAMHKDLWQTVRLKNSMVYDWNKCIATIISNATATLDTRRMLIPTKIEDFDTFWLQFTISIKKALNLKSLELYRCPTSVVEDIIYSLPQLVVLNATSLKNPNVTKEGKNPNEFMTLNLNYLGTLSNLTELRLKGLTGIKLTNLPSFENLINLRSLSLTSIKSFPKDVCRSLETITTNLAFFEIGDCDCLSKDFADVLKRLTNLTSLRLENCCSKFENYALEVFCAIRSLNKLKILELINIEFNSNVEDELEKCDGIKGLLIIPAYISQSATTNCHLIDCLKKLSNSLTHLVWGLTHELLRVTDLFITQYQQNQHTIGYNLELPHAKEPTNNIPILRTRKPKQRPGEEPVPDQDKSDNVDILSVPALEKLLETMMIHAKTKVVKVPFASTTRVYLLEHFNDLN